MNGAYLHLVINHIPVIAAPIAAVLLATGLVWKSRDLTLAGFVTLVFIALLAYPVMRTGGMAWGIVHELPGVTHDTLHAHAEAADKSFWPTLALGLLALAGLGSVLRSKKLPTGLTALALVGAIFLSIWMGAIAHLGGLIRHPEIAGAAHTASAHDDDDDEAPAVTPVKQK